MVKKLHKDPRRKAEFPALSHLNHRVTSEQSRLYNCIAYAFGDESRRWEPDPFDQYYWPPGAPREPTVDAAKAVIALNGYKPSSNRLAEKNVHKIALYAKGDIATHLAKQLLKGKWSSKLGDAEDIEHSLDALEGPHYGYVTQVFERPTI